MIDIPNSIFPKNEQGQMICPKCKKPTSACECPSFDPSKPKTDQFKPSVRLDRFGRKGKVVTLITGLPRDEEYLRELAKTLKIKTGSGGTFYLDENGGVIELQGDQQKTVQDVLRKEKFGGRR